MKLEDQVCSLELPKRLHELGFREESLFYWTAITKVILNYRCGENLEQWRDFQNEC